jgi:hypothetical protein
MDSSISATRDLGESTWSQTLAIRNKQAREPSVGLDHVEGGSDSRTTEVVNSRDTKVIKPRRPGSAIHQLIRRVKAAEAALAVDKARKALVQRHTNNARVDKD